MSYNYHTFYIHLYIHSGSKKTQ